MKLNPFPSPPDPSDKVTSYFTSPLILGLFRLVFVLYCIAVLITQIVLGYQYPVVFYAFLTILSYYAVILYFLITSSLSLYYLFKKRVPWENRPYLNIFITGLYHGLVLDCILVTCIYWSMLFRTDVVPSSVRVWTNTSVHALQSVFILIELILSKHQWNWKYPPVVAIVLFIYLAWALILYACCGILPYAFLNYHNGKIFGLSLVIVIATFIIITIVAYILHRVRNFIGLKVNK